MTKRKLRAGTLSVMLALTMVMGFAQTPAAANEVGAAKIWVGPGCPSGEWTCQTTGSVVQSSETGRDLTTHCTLQSCVVSQSNTTGDNLISVAQNFSQTSNTVSLSSITQSHDQTATLNQTNGSGTNTIEVDQSISLSANTQVQVPASQTQEAHQTVNIPLQTSDSGDQAITIAQAEAVSATLRAPEATQNQNAQPKVGQLVRIGSDSTVGMDTNSGTNALDVDQKQNFSAFATGPGGLSVLLRSTQNQGSQDQTFPAAVLDWKVDSRKFEGSTVTATQEKTISQDTTPNNPSGGKVQNIFDELAVIGQLLTTDTSLVDQTATLTQDGGYRRCVQMGTVHNKVNGELNQNCNGETQSVSGEFYTAHLEECNGTPPPGETCDESNTTTVVHRESEVQGDQGCGPGFWRQTHHLGSWPDVVQPGDLFGTHFSGAPAAVAARTMLESLAEGGGPVAALARHAAAGLINAESDDVAYPIHSTSVKQKTNDAFASGDVNPTKNELEGYNSGACPLA